MFLITRMVLTVNTNYIDPPREDDETIYYRSHISTPGLKRTIPDINPKDPRRPKRPQMINNSCKP